MFGKFISKFVKSSSAVTEEDSGETVYDDSELDAPEQEVEAAEEVEETDIALTEATALNFTFICREAVVDQAQRVVGYEYMLRNHADQRRHDYDPVAGQLDEQALLTRLAAMDLSRLLEYRYTFIVLSAQVLLRPALERLPTEVSVFLIRADSFGPAIDPNVVARMAQMRQVGYGFGLVVNETSLHILDQLHKLIHYIVLDMSLISARALLVTLLNNMGRWPETQILIKNIRDVSLFGLCKKALSQHAGIHLYQGNFLIQPLPWRSDHVDTGKTRIVSLLNGIKQEQDTTVLVESMRHDPLLLSRLLRYANSAAINPTSKVNSAERALAMLGRDNLYRQLTVLLFCSGDISERDMAIMDTALIRARFAETLGGEHLPQSDCDNLFLVGMFSLLDILLRVPLDEALMPLDLPHDVMEALLSNSGLYASYLELVIACERGDQERIALHAAKCDLSETMVNSCHMEAILWTQDAGKV